MNGLVCGAPSVWVHQFSSCLYDWQTLIAGLAAVLVGGLTVLYLRRQIGQTDRLANDERDARLTVARAKLIVPSSRLAEHARVCFDQLITVEPAVMERGRAAQPISIPELPTEIEDALDALLANTRDRNAAFAVSAVYAEQQVLSVRASDIHLSPRSHAAAYDYYCMQPVIMRAIAINLLVYARREANTVELITWEDMENSVRALASGATEDRLIAFITDKRERQISIPFAIKEVNGAE